MKIPFVKEIPQLSQSALIILTALFLVLFDNVSFFSNVVEIYPLSLSNLAFLVSLFFLLLSFIIFILVIVSYKHTIKPVLITVLLVSSVSSYFMNSYGIIIDEDMIRNTLQTNFSEALDLFNIKLVMYFILFGVIPSYFVYTINIKESSFKSAVLSKIKIILVSSITIILIIFSFSKYYASFFREHKILRLYSNPVFYIYSTGKYISSHIKTKNAPLNHIGHDAKINEKDADKELIILVVGETVRADRFSLNGYSKKTNPLLEKEDVISFKQMSSCGTSTAISVPCLFSKFTHEEYSEEKGQTYENILDLLSHIGVNILWRDNNSDSKGVALRLPHEDFHNRKLNSICDIECRDEGMLVGLQDYIDRQQGDILIVLHQMGNHGPAYYKRYPEKFEYLTPTCKDKNLENCTTEQISNSYDNAIIYTDYFLSKTIQLLKNNSDEYETALFYVSDHGESLGENGVYLHGMPYFIAPEAQTHVASIMWIGRQMEIDKVKLKAKEYQPISHDNIFHMLLGLFEVETTIYNKELDIIDHLED
ncbi:Lipid A phosphoethanolamine transferase [hydrothermal vent metagenome]|uniref:Lipid A phosphoethanolamine transferase n=1 Tax=hydrothermal vent metagenome TaxID=652676 RepID=A0A3B1AIU4_9ZZZZ